MTQSRNDSDPFGAARLKLWLSLFLGLLVTGAFHWPSTLAAPGELLVFAAASQRNALDTVIAAYEAEGGRKVTAAYQSSSALARQIERGAPADIFISANPAWMDYLQARKLIDTPTRTDMFGNRLVLATAKNNPAAPVDIRNSFNLAGLVGDGRLAIGDPDHVPAGLYAKQALRSLGVWDSVAKKLAPADNTRAALALVARGEAPYGIVYASDALADTSVKVAGTFPEDSHARIVYPIAVTKGASDPAGAKAFLGFLQSPKAAKIYRQFGFSLLATATN